MVALTKNRNTKSRELIKIVHTVAAATKIFAGSIVMLDASGDAVPGQTATGLKAVGRAEHEVDNSAGVAGDESIESLKGAFKFANDGSITRAHLEATCYVVDDQTVAATDGTGTRSAAGKIVDLDADGVWVEFD